jgi:hypothetical protein
LTVCIADQKSVGSTILRQNDVVCRQPLAVSAPQSCPTGKSSPLTTRRTQSSGIISLPLDFLIRVNPLDPLNPVRQLNLAGLVD